jgi:hypothetical protein
MKLNQFDNSRQFSERVSSYLLQHEAHHNLRLGICDALILSQALNAIAQALYSR